MPGPIRVFCSQACEPSTAYKPGAGYSLQVFLGEPQCPQESGGRWPRQAWSQRKSVSSSTATCAPLYRRPLRKPERVAPSAGSRVPLEAASQVAHNAGG